MQKYDKHGPDHSTRKQLLAKNYNQLSLCCLDFKTLKTHQATGNRKGQNPGRKHLAECDDH